MIAAGVEDDLSKRPSGYWRDLVFSRLLPALFFSVFLARQLIFTWDGLRSVHKTADYLFVLQQLLSLALELRAARGSRIRTDMPAPTPREERPTAGQRAGRINRTESDGRSH